MKLHQKLLLGFACVALIISCVGFVAQQTNQRVLRGVVQLSQMSVTELTASGDMAHLLRESEAIARRLGAARSRAAQAALTADLLGALDQFEIALMSARSASLAGRARAQAWGLAEAVARQDAKLRWLEAIGHNYHYYRSMAEEVARLTATDEAAAAVQRAGLEPLLQALHPPLQEYRRAARHDLNAGSADVQRNLSQADRFLFVAVLLGIGIALVLGVVISNSIAAPLSLLTEATRRLGSGRLDHRVSVRSSTEVTELAEALNRMAEELGATTISKQFLDNVLTSMSDPLLVLDLEGQVSLANAAVARTLGYDLEALRGQPLRRLLAEGEAGERRILRSIREFGSTGNLDMHLLTREGAHLPVVLSGALMRAPDGQPQNAVCVAKDITHQKLIERDLRAAREHAEEMARLKSSFLANMSHEIRTPLTGIIGSAQVLAELSEGESLEMAAVIERAGIRLLATINSVLDMARIEAGELQPRLETLHLCTEVRDAASVLRRLADAKSLSLEVVELESEVHAAADPSFVHRIVTNLVGNAIKFTERGGVRVEIGAEGDHVAVMRVSDTGVGIDEEFLPYLFQEFRQASTGFARRHEGSGLGLAITRRLVEMLDGDIEVESRAGAGSTFTVRLPRAPRPAQTVSAGRRLLREAQA